MPCLDCDKCGLCEFSHNPGIMGIGPKKAKIMVVGDNPNYYEDNSGVYGKGNPHKLLEELFNSSGLDIDEVYYTPAVKCRKSDKGKVSASELKECKEHLFRELDEVKPEWVITLGATALKALTNKAKITEIHGNIIDHKLGFKVLPTFHPAMSLRDPRYWDRIHTDFRKFGKIINGEELRQHDIKCTLISRKSQLSGVLKDIKKSRTIAYDLETNGLEMRLRTSFITATVLSTYRKNYVIDHEAFDKDTMSKFHRQVKRRLKGKNVIAQNGKFDNLWLHYMYGVRFPLTFDTMLASHLLDENSPNGLKYNAKRWLEMEDYDVPLKIKKGVGLNPEEKEQWAQYAASDGYATIRLFNVFKKLLAEDPELENLFYKMVMPVARTYEVLEINGTYIDLDNMSKADEILSKRLRRLTRSLNRHIMPWRKDEMEINWNSSAFINKVLFDWLNLKPEGYTDGGAPSTAEDYLIKMKKQHPIIETLLEYRGAFKQKSSFIDGWNKRMINGQIFPGFKVGGTVTGRPSCSNPNLQQVPRDPFIRSLIGAPKGWVFFEVDYSQVELRVAAAISGEPNMLQIFRTGGDIHTSTYVMLMGCTPEEMCEQLVKNGEITPDQVKAQLKEERKKAKAVNFGFIYGMGWKKFREYAEAKYQLVLTDSEAKAWRKRYFENYPGLIDWHNRQRRIVRQLEQVRTFTGRIRHLPQINSPDQGLAAEAERNAINAPVQGFGAEMILMSLVELNEYFGNNIVKMNGTIHDAIVGIVKEEYALECMARMKSIMESPRLLREFGIKLPLPVIADVSLGNWGIAKEYDAEELPEPINLDEDYEPLLAA